MGSAVSIQILYPHRAEVRTVTHLTAHSLDVAKQIGNDYIYINIKGIPSVLYFFSFSLPAFSSPTRCGMLRGVPSELLCCVVLFVGAVELLYTNNRRFILTM